MDTYQGEVEVDAIEFLSFKGEKSGNEPKDRIQIRESLDDFKKSCVCDEVEMTTALEE